MAYKRWMWLNGKFAAQNEAVYPEDDDVMNSLDAFGIENAGCPFVLPHQLYSSTSSLPHYGLK